MQVIFCEGTSGRTCSLCKRDEDQWSREYDLVPTFFLKCPRDCQVLVCRACWDQGIEMCPECQETASLDFSEVTFTEKLVEPEKLIHVSFPGGDLCQGSAAHLCAKWC